MFSDSENEFKRGISDLRKYLLKIYEKDVKKKIFKNIILLIVALNGLIVSFISVGDLFYYYIGLFFNLIGIVSCIIDLRKDSDPMVIYGPPKGKEYLIEECKGATTKEDSLIKFSELLPSEVEQDLGFLQLYNNSLSDNTAFVSSEFDNALVTSQNIPIGPLNIKKVNFVSSDPQIKLSQLRYLVAKVGDKELRTFNEKKICLQSDIKEFIQSIQTKGEKRVEIAEVGYFDGIATNEAFRSKMYICKKNTELPENPKKAEDLTKNFPMYQDDENQYRLKPQPSMYVSRHIGISTIAISSDNKIVFFRQKKNNLIGGKLLVATGSGSADLKDVFDCGNATNLKSIICYAMARELCEEAGIYRKLSKKERENKMLCDASHTMITGFFRWVDRCGKPEFVGVTKLGLPAEYIPGDDFEVIKYNPDTEIFKKKIKKLSDLIEFKDALIKGNYKLSLSFYIALERLITIASYEKSSMASQVSVFNKITGIVS